MNRSRPGTRQSTTISGRGSRIMGSSIGMGRNPTTSRSPRVSSGKFDTPQKLHGSTKKFYPMKRMIDFDARQFMVAECSVRDIQIYKQVFDFLDQDHDGNLTPLDLRKCIRQFGGYNPGRKFVYIAMSVFDSDDGGQIDFRQFIKLMTTKPYEKDTQDDLMRVFQAVDEEGKGYIDETDLLKLAEQMNEQISIEEVREALSYATTHGNGKFDFKQFVKFCKRKDYD